MEKRNTLIQGRRSLFRSKSSKIKPYTGGPVEAEPNPKPVVS